MVYDDYLDIDGLDESEDFREKQERRKKLLIIAVNSTVLYLLAYLFIYLFYYIITIDRAAAFGIKAKLYFWKIGWADPHSPLWVQNSVENVFSIGPLSSLVVALLFVSIYIFNQNRKGQFPLFCIWIIFHACNMAFGSVSVGLLTTINFPYTTQIFNTITDFIFFTRDSSYSSQGFGYVSDWLYYTTTYKIFLFIFSFIFSMLLGFYSAIFFLRASYSAQLIRTRQSLHALIIFQTIIPWLLGSIFLLLFRFPHDTRYEMYFFLTMLIMISPSLLSVLRDSLSFKRLLMQKQSRPIKLSIGYLVLMVVCYVAFRLVLANGLSVNFEH